MKRKFEIDFCVDYDWVGTAIIELDSKVINAVTDEWRSMFYNLHTPEQIAEHIAFNLVINNARLSMLDGWADMTDDMARMLQYPFALGDYGRMEITLEDTKEITV